MGWGKGMGALQVVDWRLFAASSSSAKVACRLCAHSLSGCMHPHPSCLLSVLV